MSVARSIGLPAECEECGQETRTYYGTKGPIFYGPVCPWCHPGTLLPARGEGDA
jgi:hypothetical protein